MDAAIISMLKQHRTPYDQAINQIVVCPSPTPSSNTQIPKQDTLEVHKMKILFSLQVLS